LACETILVMEMICCSEFVFQVELTLYSNRYSRLLLLFSEVQIQQTFQEYQKSSSYLSDRVQELSSTSVNIIVNPQIMMIIVENMTMVCADTASILLPLCLSFFPRVSMFGGTLA